MAKARPGMRGRQEQATKARARMAKRAKRARFYKEHKKNILLAVCGFVFIVGFMVFTPFGPDWYYNRIQMRKFSAPGQIMPGTLRDMYSLGNFFAYSFRKDQAMKIYDEIGTYYYGFTFSQFSQNPQSAMDRRYEMEMAVEKGGSAGPPYRIDAADLRYVSLALSEAAGIVMGSGRSRQFAARLYNDLYMEDFYADHPEACDPKVTELVKAAGDRLAGRR